MVEMWEGIETGSYMSPWADPDAKNLTQNPPELKDRRLADTLNRLAELPRKRACTFLNFYHAAELKT